MAYSVEHSYQETPAGMQLSTDLATGSEWDNYDVNIHTLDRKNSLHATVGICYQIVVEDYKFSLLVSSVCTTENRR